MNSIIVRCCIRRRCLGGVLDTPPLSLCLCAGASKHIGVQSTLQELSLILLCCPEDIRRDDKCKHSEHQLCGDCWIPLCYKCENACCKKPLHMNPMMLCNDNFWGYTTDLLYRYQVRWIESAIVSPCWTTMLVFYAEGDFGNLYNEELGKPKYRTAVRGSCCSFHMPWEERTCESCRRKPKHMTFLTFRTLKNA